MVNSGNTFIVAPKILIIGVLWKNNVMVNWDNITRKNMLYDSNPNQSEISING